MEISVQLQRIVFRSLRHYRAVPRSPVPSLPPFSYTEEPGREGEKDELEGMGDVIIMMGHIVIIMMEHIPYHYDGSLS